MSFSSLYFIFAFLPLLLVLYYTAAERYKNDVLLIGSVLFYGLGSWWQTGILAADIVANYFFSSRFSGKNKKSPQRRFWFWITIAANTGLLVWFKLHPPLPVGISFYTFQMLAYQIDVYREDIPCERSLLRFNTYMFFFPKVQEGPITRYGDFAPDLRRDSCRAENLESGLRFFIVGLAYKVLLADKIGGLWKQISVIGCESISTPMAWLGMAAFTLQLYFDFHGYSLMAMGLAQMFGFVLPRNFVFPYCSTSVSDFYRRWHATLGAWFRDYIYIPLGGSRHGMPATVRNLFIVWVLTGIWHGTGWNFVLWGISLFFFIALEKLFLRKYLTRWPVLGHLYVLLVIPLTWMLFANTNLSTLAVYFTRLFPVASAGINVNLGDWVEYGKGYLPYLAVGCAFLIPQPELFLLHSRKRRVLVTVILFTAFWSCIISIHNSASNPFMYLQF